MYAVPVKHGIRGIWLGIAAALMTACPLLAFVLRFGVAAPLSLFQADAFYYLDIARNSAGRPGFSFDGVHPTNGFHPVWLWILSFCRWCGWLHFDQPVVVLTRVFVLDVVLLSLAAGLFTLFSVRQVTFRPLTLLVASPGLLWFAVAPITPWLLSTWSYANGMESAVSLLLMAGALLCCRPERAGVWKDLGFGVLLGCAVLARLDDVFFAAALLVWGLWSLRLPARRLLLWTAPVVALIGAYLAYNKLAVGVYLPLSGVAKANFAALGNLRWTGKLVVPMLTRNPPVVLGLAPPDSFAVEAFRAFQTVVPAVIAFAELLGTVRSRGRMGIVQALCAGVLLKAAYNFLFVNGNNQGFWYYTVSVSVANLVLVLWLDRLLRLLPAGLLPRAQYWVPGWGVLGLYSFSALYGAVSAGAPPWLYDMIRRGPELAAAIRAGGDGCVTELNDGSASYALNLPAQAALGLALDAEASRALGEGRVLPLFVQRGCSLMVTVTGYTESVEAYVQSRAWEHGGNLFPLHAREFLAYRLVPAGKLDHGVLTLFRIEAVAQASAPGASSEVLR